MGHRMTPGHDQLSLKSEEPHNRWATKRGPNRQDLTGQIRGWKQILNTLTMHYGDRIAAAGY